MKKALILFLVIVGAAAVMILTISIIRGNGTWSVSLQRSSEKLPRESHYYVSVPKVVVNMQGSGDRYCKAGFTLAVDKTGLAYFSKEAARQVCKARIAELLSLYTYDDLATAEGKARLKEHIRAHLNQNCAPNSIKNVFFSEFIFQ